MKYRELLFMGGKTADVRYTSEIGSLLAMPKVLKVPIEQLDMSRPIETWINLKAISSEPKKLENDIKRLVLPVINEKTMPQVIGWYNKIKNEYLPIIQKEMGKLPIKYGWAAGSNVSVDGSPVDVEFSESDFGGISIKDKGGITLFSTSPKTFGIEAPKGTDNVKSLAPAEYTSWMSNSMKAVLSQAKQTKGPLSFGDTRYYVEYNPKNNTFTLQGKGAGKLVKVENQTANDILKNAGLNLDQHRVFGDWYVKQGVRQDNDFMTPLRKKVTSEIVGRVENALNDPKLVKQLVRIGPKSYFYATPQSLYLVPKGEAVGDLVARLDQAKEGRKASSFLFIISMYAKPEGDEKPNPNPAKAELFFRWRNGLFASNVTVAIQSLKTPEAIFWQKLV